MKLTDEQREVLSVLGKYGGKKSAAMLTKEQRREKAIRAINIRWAKVKAKKKA